MELKTYFAQDAAGNIISSAIVNIFLQGSTTLATGLTRADGTPLENPFAADGAGRIQFRAPDGYYDIQVSSGSGIIQTLTIQCVDYSGAKADADRAESAADRAEDAAEYLETFKPELFNNEMLNMSPLHYGAVGDADSDNATNDTLAFIALENAVSGRFIDLGGKIYLVDRDFTGNNYINGSFRKVEKLLPDDEYPEYRLQTRKKGMINGFRPSTPYHVKSGLRLATIKNTTIQGAVLDYYDSMLYVLQNVSGSATGGDEVNKIVAYNWFGQDTLTPVWETQGSSDLGHQSLGLTIGRIGSRNTRGQLQLWGLAGVSKGDDRAQYITRFTPSSGAAITPDFFRIWDDTYLNHVNVLCTDPTGTWLITTAKRYVGPGEGPGIPDQLRYYVKVYHTSVFINPTDYSYDYRNAASFEFEIADFVRDMQAVACDGTAIYFCQAGSAYSSTRKYLHMYTLDGVYLGVQQIQAGAARAWEIADPGNTGTPTGDLRYEPEAMFFRMITGGYDLVMGNTNGVPTGDAGRETSFYTLMPQQALQIKTTSSSQPGIVVDAAVDVATPTGIFSIGKLNQDGTITVQFTLDDGGIQLVGTDSAAKQFIAQNLLRKINLHVSSGGLAGIYDHTNSRWLVRSALNGSSILMESPITVTGGINASSDNANTSGTATLRWSSSYAARHMFTATVGMFYGTGSPEGVVTAGIGSTYHRADGGANTALYHKETGTGNTGWVAK